MEENEWVDFKEIKAKVTMQMILDHYGVKLKQSGSELRGQCPFHKGPRKNFQVNPDKNVFNCFGDTCGAHGNVLDFVARMENCSVRDAALKLAERFQIKPPSERPKEKAPAGDRKDKLAARKETNTTCAADAGTGDDEHGDALQPEEESAAISAQPKDSGEQGSNKPLPFNTLKNLDPKHEYIRKRGITEETAQYFQIGYCSKGIMANRIAIPIHNSRGELVACAGRWPGESGWPEEEDKYKLPEGFKKTWELYNLHRATATKSIVAILVEGFFGTMKIHQAGFPFVVASMGASLSDEQLELLRKYFEILIVATDPDPAGRKGMVNVLPRFIRAGLYPYPIKWRMQPDQLSSEEIRSVLSAIPFL